MSSTGAAVRVRKMQAADLDRVMEIAGSLNGAPQWPVSAYLRALDAEAVPRRVALVAEDLEAGAVAGFLVASVVAAEAELETIAVAAESQRRGVGRLLLAELANALRMEQVNEIILEVRRSNLAALTLYRSCGLVETGLRPRYYADPVEDAVLMGRRLG